MRVRSAVLALLIASLFINPQASGAPPARAAAPSRAQVPDALIEALVRVESGGRADAIGDGGRAVGPLQIWPAYWRDACEVLSVQWPLADRRDPAKARAAARAYLGRWGADYGRRTGRAATLEVLARIHNSGPWRGRWPAATDGYWRKVKAGLKK